MRETLASPLLDNNFDYIIVENEVDDLLIGNIDHDKFTDLVE